MVNERDIIAIADRCRSKLNLASSKLGEEYYFQSLPLCVIETVFSIGARYESTIHTVRKFCAYFGLNPCREQMEFPATSEQLPISEFLEFYDRYGVEKFASEIYRNRQRTSTRNGILKSEAVLMFAKVLRQLEVDYFQDSHKVMGDQDFEARIKTIPGQRSGISTRYFYMLLGSEEYIKPDRMVERFIGAVIQQKLSVEASHELIVGAQQILAKEYPHLTPRLLDYLIWQYQRAIETNSIL
jgi:hypothetical protein